MMNHKTYEKVLIKKCFVDKDVLSQVISFAPEDFFKDELHDLFFKSMQFIYKERLPVNTTSMRDVLTDSGNKDHIEFFTEIVSSTYPDEKDWKYHLNACITFYNRAKMLSISHKIQENTIIWTNKQMHSYLESIQDDIVFPKKDLEHISMLVGKVQEDAVSEKLSYLESRYLKLDRVVTLSPETVLLIAGGKGSGKSRFTLSLIDRVLTYNEDVSVMWLNFEMSNISMVQLMISRRCGLTTKQISRKGYSLSAEDMIGVNKAIGEIEGMDIEFCSKPMSINEIASEFKKFCAKRENRRNILVIDNLGLLTNGGKSQVEVDEYVAKRIVQIREETKGLIIPIHHLTKEQGTRGNMKMAYSPKIEDIRGSTRIPDYANQVLLIHKPSNFKDLMTQEQMKGTYTNQAGITIDRARVLKNLIIIDVAKNRDDSQEYIRFTSNLGLCRFQEWEAK